MARNKQYGKIFESLTIENAGSNGYCIARHEGRVIFVKYAVPGDIADIKIIGKKKKMLIGEIVNLHTSSPNRIEPFCLHYGTCGGCKWQHINYTAQITNKEQEVKDAFDRIGKLNYPEIFPIIGSEKDTFYRNKMEFAFSNNRWLDPKTMELEEFVVKNALGFHAPGRFDKVVHVEKCWLQEDFTNTLRNGIYQYAENHDLSFFDHKRNKGLLRGLMLRKSTLGNWMLVFMFGEKSDKIQLMMEYISSTFSELSSIFYTINEKANDSIYDLDLIHLKGDKFMYETINGLTFSIRPKSFFQTNPYQAKTLYSKALEMGNISDKELIYDLYCGTGTISLFLAQKALKVIGIESVPQAIEDAYGNAQANDIQNIEFIVGDMKDVLNTNFVEKHGSPNVIYTDPPRAGMHPKVVKNILEIAPDRIVYISCNPATQARDLNLMEEKYNITRVQPVDMFPHTHHVENIVLLIRK